MDNWTNVNLTELGDNVKTLQFDLNSSDNSTYYGVSYMNTPPTWPGRFECRARAVNIALLGRALVGLAVWRRRLARR